MKRKIERILELEGERLHDAIKMLLCSYDVFSIKQRLRLLWMDSAKSQQLKMAEKIEMVQELVSKYEEQLNLNNHSNER